MIQFLTLSELSTAQKANYHKAIKLAFPEIILASPISKRLWPKLEEYYPECQLYLLNKEGQLIGFMNTIPIFWEGALKTLPDEGWDWLLEKGIQDYENKVKTNFLGGLQIIVTKEHLGQVNSRLLLREGKRIQRKHGFDKLIIPIRPTFKSKFPNMAMSTYLNYKEEGQIYDPWIRTHLKGGAKVIKVCNKSMSVTAEIPFWEKLMNKKIESSGYYLVDGALNPVKLELEKNVGCYEEEKNWLYYN